MASHHLGRHIRAEFGRFRGDRDLEHLARQSARLSERISDVRAEMHQVMDHEMDIAIGQFGETIAAVRQKMTDIELWNRDNFVSKQTFNMIIAENRDSIRRLEDKIDSRFDKIEAKLETYQRG